MELYAYNDYRQFLADLCSDEKAPRGFQARLAKSAGCQASYFSQILKAKVHLTEDQALGVTQALSLTNLETEYFLLLLRMAKAATPRLRTYLEKSLQSARAKRLDISQSVDADRIVYNEEELGRYLSSWIPTAIHLLTSSEDYRTPQKMATRLQIPLKTVKETLDLLLKMKLVRVQGDEFFYNQGTMHVPKDSPWQSAMQTSRRQLALKSIAINPEEATHFSSVFTISKKDAEKIQLLINELIQKSHKAIVASGSDELYSLCIDFFEVV